MTEKRPYTTQVAASDPTASAAAPEALGVRTMSEVARVAGAMLAKNAFKAHRAQRGVNAGPRKLSEMELATMLSGAFQLGMGLDRFTYAERHTVEQLLATVDVLGKRMIPVRRDSAGENMAYPNASNDGDADVDVRKLLAAARALLARSATRYIEPGMAPLDRALLDTALMDADRTYGGADQEQPGFSTAAANAADTAPNLYRGWCNSQTNRTALPSWEHASAPTRAGWEAAAEASSRADAVAQVSVRTGMYASQEPKYGILGNRLYNRASGEFIPTDEPVFVFRARDRYARAGLSYYMGLFAQGTHRGAIEARIREFNSFASAHPDRMKEPDTASLFRREVVGSVGMAESAHAGETTAAQLARLEADNARLLGLVNTPELRDFAKGAVLEAVHQNERYGASGGAGKMPTDFFWLVGFLAGKALKAHVTGDVEKALHHTISTAAACANWHVNLLGGTTMRPGIETPPEWAADDGQTDRVP
jgi:hypothetical protein